MRQIRESKDIAEICSKWTAHLTQPTRTGKKNEDEDKKGAAEMSPMLELIQTLVGSPSSAIPLNTTHDTALSNLKNADAEMAVTSHCCSYIWKLFRTKQLISSEEMDLQVVPCNNKRSILLGHSDNVDVNIEILDGKPRFNVSMSQASKDGNQKNYHGLYRWPRQGEQGQADLFLGEFSNGEHPVIAILMSAHFNLLIRLFLKGRFHGYGSVVYFDGGFFK